jgi:ABC-type Fe3+ transport system substrate-binding protein
MRRSLPIILFLVVLLTPLVLSFIYGTTSQAKFDPSRTVVIISAHPESIRREFAEAFARWHQEHFGSPAQVEFRNVGGGGEVVQYFTEAQSQFDRTHTYQIDLIWGGGDYFFENKLKYFGSGANRKPGCLEAIQLPDDVMRFAFPNPTLDGVQLYDVKDHTWYGTALASFGVCYNRDVCRVIGAIEPTQWNDLADARWNNWLVLADPTMSASAAMSFMIIVERAMIDAQQRGESVDRGWAQGMGLVRLIASNARMFTDSGSSVPGIVASGDAGAGMVIDFYGRTEVEAVGANRMAYIEPAGATAINPDPIAMVKGAPHRELAMHFIEFVLSPDGQKLWNTRAGAPGGPRQTSLRRLPIAPSIYNDPANMTDQVNPFTGTLGFATSDARRKTFPFMGVLLQVSCIDLLDELRETRLAIDKRGRADLLARLGMFPFDQAEAMKRASGYFSANPLQQLEMERKWEMEFKNEYAELRDEALNGNAKK